MVYIILNESSSSVKIGYTGCAPEERLKALQTGSDAPLTLVACFEGDRSLERALHDRFAAHRSIGEWFTVPCDDVVDAATVLSERIQTEEELINAWQRATEERSKLLYELRCRAGLRWWNRTPRRIRQTIDEKAPKPELPPDFVDRGGSLWREYEQDGVVKGEVLVARARKYSPFKGFVHAH